MILFFSDFVTLIMSKYPQKLNLKIWSLQLVWVLQITCPKFKWLSHTFVAQESAICCQIVHRHDHVVHMSIYRANWTWLTFLLIWHFFALESAICCKIVHRHDHIVCMCSYLGPFWFGWSFSTFDIVWHGRLSYFVNL